MENEIALRDQMEAPEFTGQLALALPKHLTKERFCRIVATAMNKNPKLHECEPSSFFTSILQLAQLGIEPDGRRAHLIPFNNTYQNRVECQYIIDYKGYVELAMNTGNVSSIHADVVCENDVFNYSLGSVTEHRIDFRKPRGKAYAAYCIITFKDGSKKCEAMGHDELMAIRDRSQGYRSAVKLKKSHPWMTDENEMAKKTVFRRASKWIKLSPEVYDALANEDSDDLRNITPAPSPTAAFAPREALMPAAVTQAEPAPQPVTMEAVVVAPEPAPAQAQVVTLESVVTEAGFTFAQFKAFADKHYEVEAWATFDDVPADVAPKLIKARVKMLAGIQAVVEEGGAQ